MQKLRDAIVYNRTLHPERTNATLERILEVTENVLQNRAEKHIEQLTSLLLNVPLRQPLNEVQADIVVDFFTGSGLSRDELQRIAEQLEYS